MLIHCSIPEPHRQHSTHAFSVIEIVDLNLQVKNRIKFLFQKLPTDFKKIIAARPLAADRSLAAVRSFAAGRAIAAARTLTAAESAFPAAP